MEAHVIEASPRQAAGNVLPDGRASQRRKDDNFLDIRSLTPQPAKHCRQAEPTGNALAYAVHCAFAGLLNIEYRTRNVEVGPSDLTVDTSPFITLCSLFCGSSQTA
jgi:hypothetical protein